MITFYNNTFGKEHLDVSLDSILSAIKNGRWADQVAEYRAMEKSSESAREYKRTRFPAITVSGTFDAARRAAKIKAHSGFIAMDFDSFPPGETLDDARSQLYADPYTYAGFVSVSGQGLCVIVKIDSKRHDDAFFGLERYYFTKYGYQIDQSCKDVSRLRFVSSDPDLHMNASSERFDTYLQKEKGRKPSPKANKVVPSSHDDMEYILSQIESGRLDITAQYNDWIAIGASIKSKYGLGGLDYFQRISQFHPEYDPDKTERKYNSFPSGESAVGFGLFVHICKQRGIETVTPQTKHVTTVALYAKKTNRTPEDTLRQLETVDNIPAVQAEPIVRQVFEAKDAELAVSLGDDEDLLQQLQEHLRRAEKIRFNEITLKYELNGSPMTDRDMNTVYLNAKSVIPKVSKELVMSCVDSDRTVTINPVKDFFAKHSGKSVTGNLINALADTIYTGRDNKDFVRYFVRKWMIGSVAMWHKHHSPLMLILAGTRQNTGKSHWFRYLLPQELQPYYAEAELTGDKDENLLMCSKLLVMNDEMSNKSKRDITMVKKLCSAKWFNLRRPYGRFSEDFRRIASLAGTSNDLALLNDPTGNRRLVPIDVLSIDHAGYNAINKVELWVEAYHAYKSGESFELTHDDISALAQQTEDFEEPSAEAESISAFFEPGNQQKLTNTQIKSYVEIRTKQKMSAKKIGQELRRLGFECSKTRVNSVPMQVYGVRERSGIMVQTFLEDEAPF
jgi:hypothetical protein